MWNRPKVAARLNLQQRRRSKMGRSGVDDVRKGVARQADTTICVGLHRSCPRYLRSSSQHQPRPLTDHYSRGKFGWPKKLPHDWKICLGRAPSRDEMQSKASSPGQAAMSVAVSRKCCGHKQGILGQRQPSDALDLRATTSSIVIKRAKARATKEPRASQAD
jgi:uncharacterized protein (DUF2249 family)